MQEQVQSFETPITETQSSEVAEINSLLAAPDAASTTPVETPFTSVDLATAVNKQYLEDKSISGFKTVDDLAKAYQNANKLIGKRMQDLSPDEIKALGIKAGAPESKDAYDFGDVKLDPEEAVKYKDIMFKLGLSKDAAKEFVAWQDKETTMRVKLEEQAILNEANNNVRALKEEFGSSFDERIAVANKALKHFGGEELAKVLNDYGLGTNPAIIKALVKAGQLVSEGTLPGASSRAVGATPVEIDQQIKDIMNSQDYEDIVRRGIHGLTKKNEFLSRLDKLYALKHGG